MSYGRLAGDGISSAAEEFMRMSASLIGRLKADS